MAVISGAYRKTYHTEYLTDERMDIFMIWITYTYIKNLEYLVIYKKTDTFLVHRQIFAV